MNKFLAWLIALTSTFIALVIFVVIKDIGKHIYPASNGARSDALYSLAIGAVGLALVYGVLLTWRATKKARTGKAYIAGKILLSKNIGKAGFTELMFVSSLGDVEKTSELLAKGIDINAQDEQGKTALMFASMNGQLEVVVLLVQAGGNPNLTTKAGHDASWFASNQGFNEIVSTLTHR